MKSIYRKVHEMGLSPKYQVGEDFRLRAKTLSDISFLPMEQVTQGVRTNWPDVRGEELAAFAYFEATYIGRATPAGSRRPNFEHRIWNADRRMALGPSGRIMRLAPPAAYSQEP